MYPCMLIAEVKALKFEIYQPLLSCHENEGEEFLYSIVTADEHGLIIMIQTKGRSMEYHHKASPEGGEKSPDFGKKSHGFCFLET